MIRCSCWVNLDESRTKIMLVKVRENQKWYLPGGKIELNESRVDSLSREIQEELGVILINESIKHLITVCDKAYGQSGNVELNCFTADYLGEIMPLAEISEIRYINWSVEKDIIAPAVLTMLHTNEFINFIKN